MSIHHFKNNILYPMFFLKPLQRYFISILLTLMVLFSSFCFLGAPLFSPEEDGAWLFMNAHFAYTGEYVHDSLYPSFKGASRYYALGGYSTLLLLAHPIASFFNIPRFIVIKTINFILYFLGGFLCFRISQVMNLGRWDLIATFLYFSYFPFLNYATILYYELFALVLFQLAIFAFIKGIKESKREWLWFAFFMTGYATFDKPVFAICLLPMISILYRQKLEGKRVKILALSAFFFFMPLITHSIVNKNLYGDYRIRTGTGFHLWNRIVVLQQKILNRNYSKRPNIPWWDAASLISKKLGYSEDKCENILFHQALDELKTYPLIYFQTTFMAWWYYLSQTQPPKPLFLNYDDYYLWLIEASAFRPNWQPMVGMLLFQKNYYKGKIFSLGLTSYYRFSKFYETISNHHKLLILFFFIFWGAILIRDSGVNREINLMVFSVPFLISFATALMEQTVQRYQLPFFPFMILGATAFFKWVFQYTLELLSVRFFESRRDRLSSVPPH